LGKSLNNERKKPLKGIGSDRFMRGHLCFVTICLNKSYLSKKIRSCFFEADESKMVNCVPASATAQHIEASIIRHQ